MVNGQTEKIMTLRYTGVIGTREHGVLFAFLLCYGVFLNVDGNIIVRDGRRKVVSIPVSSWNLFYKKEVS